MGGFLNMEKLTNEAPLPAILHWGQDHFVILYKIKKKQKKVTFYIADPALGHIEYTQEKFESNWISITKDNRPKGIILLLNPLVCLIFIFGSGLCGYSCLRKNEK